MTTSWSRRSPTCSSPRPPRAWEERLTEAGVACVEVFGASHSEFTCTDPVLRETGLVVEVEHPRFGPVLRAGPPVALSETPARVAPGCLVGQHTAAILAELGYAPERIDELTAQGTVFGGAPHAGEGATT